MTTMRNLSLAVMPGVILAACATAYKISRVQIGMTEEEVIAVMGPPVNN
jgi:outer membrane protein assembly factor BamE (lipoprotein component of BamABCDE complex)